MNTANAAEVFDKNGNEAPCGHQRPIEAIRQFLAGAERLLQHVEGRSAMQQEMARTRYERLRQELDEAEAAQEGN